MLVEFKKNVPAAKETYKDSIAVLLNFEVEKTRQVWNDNNNWKTFKKYEWKELETFKTNLTNYEKAVLHDEKLQ